MKILSTLILILSIVFCSSAFAQKTIKLQLDNAYLTIEDVQYSLPPQMIDLQQGKATKWEWTSESGTVIRTKMRIRGYNSRTSSHKDSGIRLRTKYKVWHRGSKEKEMVERMWFINDDRTFSEKEDFIFSKGLYNHKLVLTYDASLPK